MEVINVDLNKPERTALDRIAEALQQGKVIALPTDTCYGLAGNGLAKNSVEKIFTIKKRERGKAISLMVRDYQMADELAWFDRPAQKIFHYLLPGPLTLVLPAKREALPKSLLGNSSTVGLRMPHLPLIKKLMAQLDFPLTATSANLSGQDNLYSAEEIKREFDQALEKPDLLIDGGVLPKRPASTVVEVKNGEIRILREGPVSERDIERYL